MHCPKCGTKLRLEQYGYWSCPCCGGEWWTRSDGDWCNPGKQEGGVLICPECQVPMYKVSDSDDDVEYWRCPTCEGQWWEPGEDFLARWLAMGAKNRKGSGPEPVSFQYVPGHRKGGGRSGRRRAQEKARLQLRTERYILW